MLKITLLIEIIIFLLYVGVYTFNN